jgi:phosphate starvation-inducible PhoH-like protein
MFSKFTKEINLSKRKTSVALRKAGRSNAKPRYYDEFDSFLESNVIPMISRSEPNQKKFSIHDLKNVGPITDSQEKFFDLWNDGYNIAAVGSAGTGKSYLSLYMALSELLSGHSEYQKIIIVRSQTPAREVGFLPGSIEEKAEIYELPYKTIFDELFKKTNQYKFMKEAGLVEFQTTSFIRGLTFKNAIVIFDECQNATFEELGTVVTRLSDTSKLIICGDTKQNDLVRKKTDVSGFPKFIEILNMMPSFRTVNYTIDDIVRGGIVKEFLIAEERYDSYRNN